MTRDCSSATGHTLVFLKRAAESLDAESRTLAEEKRTGVQALACPHAHKISGLFFLNN
jgi:hypothetical protein